MELVLWRHADAEPGASDLARRLSAKGEKQARRMAQWLHANLPESTRIYSSPAARTQQTAQALVELGSRKLHIVDALAPGAAFEDVLAAVEWPSGPPTVVVGHQPTLGNVASWLMTGTEHDWAIKKGAVWWLRRREGDDTVVFAVVSPDLV